MCRNTTTLLIILLIALIITPSASAGNVNRTVTIQDNSMGNYTYKTMVITLVPTPFSDFSLPGYLVEEYIPNGATFMETSADWYKLDGSKLIMLRFNPTQDNAMLTYKISFPLSGGTYIFTGKFMDRSTASGDIAIQEIVIDKSTYSGTSSASSNNTAGNYWGKKEEIKVAESTQLSSATPEVLPTAQKLPAKPDGGTTYIIFVALLIVVMFFYKRYGKRVWDRLVVTEYIFIEEDEKKKL